MFRSISRFVFVTLLLVSLEHVGWSATSDKVVWQSDLFQAYHRAKAESKPLVVYFYGEGPTGLLPCSQQMEEGPLASREFAAYQDRAVFVRINMTFDDKNGNVKNFISGLNVTELPTIAVVECQADGWVNHGKSVGLFEKEEFIRNFRSDIVRAMIGIRRSAQSPVAASELNSAITNAWAKVDGLQKELEVADVSFQAQKKELLESGKFDGRNYAAAMTAHREVVRKLTVAILDFAALPTSETQEVGQILMETNFLDSDLCDRVEQDIESLAHGGVLSGSSVQQAQSILREANGIAEVEFQRVNGPVRAAAEKLAIRLRQVAAQ